MAFNNRDQEGGSNLTAQEIAWVQVGTGGVVNLAEGVAPSATVGYGKLYVKTSDSNLYFKTAAGAEHQLTPAGGTGTVTSVSVVTANGISGTVATATTTPAITLTLGAITPTTVNGLTITVTTGTITLTNAKTLAVTNSLTFSGTDSSTLNIGTGGTLGTAAYTAATAYEAAGAVATHAALQTGVHGISITAAKVFSATNTLTLSGTDSSTLNIGTGGTLGTAAYTATTAYEASGAVATHAALQTGVHGISITAGKVFSASNTLTLAGTDSSTLNIGTGGTLGTMAYETATSYIAKATYDAHTILYATTDDTPVALTVGEQTVVGRATGGNIAALAIDSDLSSVSANDDTIPSAKATKAALDAKLALAGGTLTGEVNLGENAGLILDAALSADGKYSGIVESGTAGETLAFGDLCYLKAADSQWYLTDANAAGTAGDVILGFCVLAANDNAATKILKYGKIRADAKFPTMTIAAPVYVGETAGTIVVTQPTTADVIIRRVGFALTADELMVEISPDYITHV